MSEGKVDRRTFTQGATVALGALMFPSLPAWAQGTAAKKRNVVIGHTGSTWPGRARGGGPGGRAGAGAPGAPGAPGSAARTVMATQVTPPAPPAAAPQAGAPAAGAPG